MDKIIKIIQELKGMIYKSKQPLMNKEMGKIDLNYFDKKLTELYNEVKKEGE